MANKHLCKFQAGDRIVANEDSDGVYSITCARKGYTGYVTAIIDIDENQYASGCSDIEVCEDLFGIATAYTVNSSYFDLAESHEDIVPPEGDLFTGLF